MTNHTLPRLAGALLAGLLVLASVGAPMAALAADPVAADAQPTDAQPTDAQPTDGAPSGDVMDDGFDGEVVYDPSFISPEPDGTPDATSEPAPVAAVRGGTGRPQLTPPATDRADAGTGRQGGPGVPFLLGALATLSLTLVALGRIPATRRR